MPEESVLRILEMTDAWSTSLLSRTCANHDHKYLAQDFVVEEEL